MLKCSAGDAPRADGTGLGRSLRHCRDLARHLRSTLVQCRSLTEKELLEHLIDLFADKDKAVRAEVVRAVEQLAPASASPLLRLRAVLGSEEPEVLRACYGGVLRIEGVRAIPWVQRFLAAGDDSAAEAALAIAGTHSAEGFQVEREMLRSGNHGTSAGKRTRSSRSRPA